MPALPAEEMLGVFASPPFGPPPSPGTVDPAPAVTPLPPSMPKPLKVDAVPLLGLAPPGVLPVAPDPTVTVMIESGVTGIGSPMQNSPEPPPALGA